jgi:hypothetical protein
MMARFSQLTLRNFMIAAHDALATALALLASFYLRFEGDFFFVRLPLLLRILPWFVALSVIVCYVFNLTTTKWRFISLPDALNILRAASVLTFALLVLDYILFHKHSRILLSAGSPSFFTGFSRYFPERIALWLSLFPIHPDAASCPDRGGVVRAAGWPRGRCGNCIAWDRKRRRQTAVAGRRTVAIDL